MDIPPERKDPIEKDMIKVYSIPIGNVCLMILGNNVTHGFYDID